MFCAVSRGFCLTPYGSYKGTLKTESYLDILENTMLPTSCHQLGEGPFLFQQDRDPFEKTWVVKS